MTTEETLYVIDMDRVLVNPDRAAARLNEIVEGRGLIAKAQLQEEQRAVQASGGSFDVIGYLAKSLSPDILKSVTDEFQRSAKPEELTYNDVGEFLKTLGGRIMIMTYGGEQWQELKLKAAGLSEYRHLVTDQKEKGTWLAAHRDDLPAGKIVLVDDKAVSFTGLPDDMYGYWLVRPDEPAMPSQQGKVPAHVQTVTSLPQIVTQEHKLAV